MSGQCDDVEQMSPSDCFVSFLSKDSHFKCAQLPIMWPKILKPCNQNIILIILITDPYTERNLRVFLM